jgi:hypothetical protein
VSRALASIVFFGGPIVAAVAASQIVNRWMTGSMFLSPYVFGDADFKSVDLLHPHPLAVLLHPWHGLLSYHPFLLVPILLLGASATSILRGRSGAAALLAPAVFVAFCAQLWLQSSWYCWWLGTDTFGMRAFAPAMVPILIAAATPFEKAMQGSSSRGILSTGAITGFVLAATTWSGLLLTQGPTNFTSLSELLLGQAYGIWALLSAPSTLVAGVVAVGLIWLGFGNRAPKTASPSDGLARFAMTIVLFILLRAVLAQEGAIALAALLASAALLAEALKRFGSWNQPKAWQGLVRVSGFLLAVAWICAQLVFIRLAIQVESQLRPNPDGETFHVQEVFDSYREYLEVSGFEGEKRALANFLSTYRDEPRKFGPPSSP